MKRIDNISISYYQVNKKGTTKKEEKEEKEKRKKEKDVTKKSSRKCRESVSWVYKKILWNL